MNIIFLKKMIEQRKNMNFDFFEETDELKIDYFFLNCFVGNHRP